MRRAIGAIVGAVGGTLMAAGPARADTQIFGGGAAASAATIVAEMALYHVANPSVSFPSYPATTTTKVQTAILLNDPTQLGLPAGGTVHLGSAEQPLSATQLAQWKTVTTGQAQAGNLIQIPAFGVALSFPIVNAAMTANGQVTLSDDQLCGIFSGLITDWSQVSTALTPGTITVVYRPESAGTSFQLTQHLAAVCNSSNSRFPLPMTPSTTFSTVFGSAGVPANFKTVTSLAGVAEDMNGAETSAIAYISPDWTSYAPNASPRLQNGQRSKLVIAALRGSGSQSYLPSIANITTALNNPGAGAINPLPPGTQDLAASPLNWLPRLPLVTKGYPIVSYTAFVLPQCFADPAVAKAIRGLLRNHYDDPAYGAVQKANLQVRIASTSAVPFLRAVNAIILSDAHGWQLNVQNRKACKAYAGR